MQKEPVDRPVLFYETNEIRVVFFLCIRLTFSEKCSIIGFA